VQNSNALIEDNIIHDVGFGIGGQAISCDGLQNSRIQNNLIYNTWSKGISLYVVNASAGSTNNIVVNNTVITGDSGSTGVAMRIDGASLPFVKSSIRFVAVGVAFGEVNFLHPPLALQERYRAAFH